MANPRHDDRFRKYRDAFLRYVSPATARGLEIGAFDLPFVQKDQGQVDFLDRATTEDLRDVARAAPGHSPDFVVSVDFVIKSGDWNCVPDDYDWVAAAHVIEHAPDMVGWLKEVGGRLRGGGILFLVIPDKRYTFDYYRPESSLGKILDDHRQRKGRPGPAEVFDSRYYTREIDQFHLWNAGSPPDFDPAQSSVAQLPEPAGYEDIHCNVFSRNSFSTILSFLCIHGHIPFRVVEVGETEPNEMDFHCVLERI